MLCSLHRVVLNAFASAVEGMKTTCATFVALASILSLSADANSGVDVRNAKLTGIVSGSYHHLDVSAVTGRVSKVSCAGILDLTLKHVSGQKFELHSPSGLVDPTEECGPVPGFKPSKSTVINYGETLGLLSQLLAHSRSTKTNLVGSLPPGALKCKGTAAFGSILISSLRGDVAAAFRSRLEGIGISPNVLADVFDEQNSETKWHSSVSASVHQNVQAVLDKLEKSFSLVLPGTTQDPVEMTMATVLRSSASWNPEDSCVYFGGQLSLLEILQNVEELIKAIRPLLEAPVYAPILIPKGMRSYYAASRSCPAVGGTELTTIRILEDDTSGVAEGRDTHVTVWVNDYRCSETVLSRLLESENSLSEGARATADKILAFLRDSGELQDHTEGVLSFFPGLAREMNEAQMKSELFVAELDAHTCPGFSRSKPLTLIFVEKASNLFYCNVGTTTLSCLDSKGTRSLYGASLRQYATSSASIFVTSELSNSACILSTSAEDEGSVDVLSAIPVSSSSNKPTAEPEIGYIEITLSSTAEASPETVPTSTPEASAEASSTYAFDYSVKSKIK